MNAAVCDLCKLPVGTLLPILVYLYAVNAGVSTDPQSLMTAARCIECNIPTGALLPILVYLAAQSASGGGGTGAVLFGAGLDPNVAGVKPTNTAAGAMYYSDTANPGIWTWSVANQAWVNIIAGS